MKKKNNLLLLLLFTVVIFSFGLQNQMVRAEEEKEPRVLVLNRDMQEEYEPGAKYLYQYTPEATGILTVTIESSDHPNFLFEVMNEKDTTSYYSQNIEKVDGKKTVAKIKIYVKN